MLELSRMLTQFCASILYNANFFSNLPRKIIPAGKVCVPGFNCAYCPGAIAGCPVGTLQYAFGSGLMRLPFYALASIMLIALLLGRIICGWLCPFGLLQDLLYKIPTPKLMKNSYTAKLTYLKYAVLLGAVILLPLYYFVANEKGLATFCEYLCPNGLFSGLFMVATGTGFGFGYALINSTKVLIAFLFVGGAIFIYRAFCRFFCPLGAFYALFSKISIYAICVDKEQCIGCNACIRNCLLDVKHIGDSECIACGKCKSHCPTNCIYFGCRYSKTK
ncbi:4Fe-4S binding protein [Phascolarctobacterium sp.]|uniref:4Fe-4S binding protein n=1 Tax=Phascolarctobacterium sp. TaxID=2049039 RepID=UPI0038649EB8